MNNVTKERCRWAIVELQAWFNYKPPLQVYRNAGKLRNEINKAAVCLTETDVELLSEQTKKVLATVVDPRNRIFSSEAQAQWTKFKHDHTTKMITQT